MKHEIISLDQFADLWESALNNADSESVPGSPATVHRLRTFEGDDVIVVMVGDSGVLIRP